MFARVPGALWADFGGDEHRFHEAPGGGRGVGCVVQGDESLVRDNEFDFAVKPRLSTAILVASSIYETCKYFTLFQNTSFKGQCAVVTSYNPQAGDVSLEDTNANTQTDHEFLFETYFKILEDVTSAPGKTKTETYEDEAKRLFNSVTKPQALRWWLRCNPLLRAPWRPLMVCPAR